jgi:glycogen operon protein
MLSAGTPMFRMGDEFLNTQYGNSNPYNQDNETSWLDWTKAETNADVLHFVRKLIAFRKAHPSISRSRFWRDDIKWYGTNHHVDLSPGSTCLAYCLHGQQEGDGDLYIMLNNGHDSVTFGIQEGSPGQWNRVIDTALPGPQGIEDESVSAIVNDTFYQVGGESIVALLRRPPAA